MNFKPEYYLLYIVISLSAAVITSYLYYKKANFSGFLKITLTGLRSLSIFLILILLFVSYITLSKKIIEKPVNIYLIDNSLSMTLENRESDLRKSLEYIISQGNSSSEDKLYTFSSDIIKETDNGKFQNSVSDEKKNFSTNLSNTLNTLLKIYGERKISTINIISDGIINEGGNPLPAAQRTNAIFNYSLTGDTIQKNDLSLKNVFFNNIVYAGSSTQVLTEFNSYNYNKIINIKLYEEDNLIQTKEINVKKENTFYSNTFNIKSSTEGIRKYRIELENEPDEITFKNNSEEFYIKFINNKFKILVLSGNPSADFSYLAEAIKSINNFDAKFFTQKAPGTFYEGQLPSLDEFQILLLINFPNSSTDIKLLNGIYEDLKIINLPLFFISGSNTDYEKLKMLINYLPISSINTSGSDEKSKIKYISDLSSETNNYYSIGSAVNNSPEIYLPGINTVLKPEARTIFYATKISKPVLIVSGGNERGSAAFLAYDFYKWRLNIQSSDTRNILEKILSGVVINISDKTGGKKVSFNTDKQNYYPNANIKINGTINQIDAKGNVIISLQIYNNFFNKDIKVTRTSGSSFTGMINGIDTGEYFIKSTLLQNGAIIGEDINKIMVKQSNLEFKDTKSDAGILNNLSILTGGDRITEQNYSIIKEKTAQRNKADLNKQEVLDKVFLNSSLLIFSILIITLSIEWFLRKRFNLP